MNKIAICLCAALILPACSSEAGRHEKIKKVIERTNANEIEIDCDLGAGEFYMKAKDQAEVAVIDIDYDRRRVDYVVEYEESRDVGYLTLESEGLKSGINTNNNVWDILLSTRYKTTVNMDIGACEAEFDFGGIPLISLNIDVGAASGFIDFSKPNPTRVREISIDAGASSLSMTNIGNARFDSFNFSGGVGSFEFDFRGDYRGESEIDMEIGLGSAEIILPTDVPVRIEIDGSGWFSSVDFHHDDLEEIDDDIWESEGFDRTDNRIIVIIEVGMGSIDIDFRD